MMLIHDLDIPIPINTLQKNNQQILSINNRSTISASTTKTRTTTNSNGSNNEQDGQDDKQSLMEPIHPTRILLPENCTFAPTKDNAYFHGLFKSVPEHDRLLEVYKCALHRDILLQGHLYLSENFACFHANIFGWITNLVVEYNEVTLIERKMTAMIIPNGIQINTRHAKHTFASFIFRETAYQQLTSLWTMHQPQQHYLQQQQEKEVMDEWATDDSDNENTDDEEDTVTTTLGQRHVHINKSLLPTTTTFNTLLSQKWNIILLIFLLLNSLWMVRKWIQLNHRLQHHQSLFEPPQLLPSLSSSYFDTHSIYTKLGQIRHQMESLNQQIIHQQLHIFDLSPLSSKLNSLT